MFSPSSTPMNPDGRYHLHMSGKLPSCQLLDDRMEQYDSLFPEAQRRINTGERKGLPLCCSGGCLNI